MSNNSAYAQTIQLMGCEDDHFEEITEKNVIITSSPGKHDHGSSKVTLKNIVDYNWEHKMYLGHLVAVHMMEKYIAYGIKVAPRNNDAPKTNGMVRVLHRDTSTRALIKGLVGQAQDLSFSQIPSQVVLASIDEEGNLFVHSIEGTETITCTLLLNITHWQQAGSPTSHRVIWCPYIPENSLDIEEEVAKLLVVTHGSKAEMISVPTIIATYGDTPIVGKNINEGFLELNEHSQTITDAMFAPDGTAIATASCDGEVKFFQVYMHNTKENKPRCLHQWKPHDGKPVTSMFFLDNHKSHNPETQFWKFVITGSDNNSEIKLWSCESWTCLQTLTFQPHPSSSLIGGPNNGSNRLVFKAGMDKSANYLLLSDVFNGVIYVLQVVKNATETHALIRSVAEFLLPYCILSFGIADAGLHKYKSNEDLYHLEGTNGGLHDDDVEDLLTGQRDVATVTLRLYVVQPKSLQECLITYRPVLKYNPLRDSSQNNLNRDAYGYKEELSDISNGTHLNKSSPKEESQQSLSLQDIITGTNGYNIIPPQKTQPLQMMPPAAPMPPPINLMTPDAFSSSKIDYSSIKVEDLENTSKTSDIETALKAFDGSVLQAKVSGSPSIIGTTQTIEKLNLSGDNIRTSPPLATSDGCINEGFTKPESFRESGGSSPSREVQEILSLKDSRSDLLDLNYNEPVLKSVDGWPCPPVVAMDNAINGTQCSPSASNSNSLSNMIYGHNIESGKQTRYMEKIFHLLAKQSNQISVLQLEVQDMRNRLEHVCESNLENNANVEQVIDTAVSRCFKQYTTSFEKVLCKRENDMTSEFSKIIIESVIEHLNTEFIDRCSAKLSHEIECNVIPSVGQSFENLKIIMEQELTRKMQITDELLRDNITKLMHSKNIAEVLGNSMLTGVQSGLSAALKDNVNTLLVPAYERATNQMFKQIQDTFTQGTREYMSNIETNLEKHHRQMDRTKDVISQMTTLSETMRVNTETIKNMNQWIADMVSRSMSHLQDNLIKTLTSEIIRAFKKQSEQIEDQVLSAVRSTAVTPAPLVPDIQMHQAQINTLLSQNQINSAFQHALTAADLSLVVYVCERVNPTQVFSQEPCPLHQNVVLSLIQQLSADMAHHTDLKQRYLEEAILNLDTTNSVTREHMPTVLTELVKQLHHYLGSNPVNPFSKKLKKISLMTQSLLNN